MESFKVSSSFGYLIVDTNTGSILECNSSKSKYDYLPNLKRFDVRRFKQANNLNSIPQDVDILRFAYWTKNNIYETPADGYEPISTDYDFFNKSFSVK